MMKTDLVIESGGMELIDRIQPLWKDLKDHHIEMAGVLAGGIIDADFQERREELQEKGLHHLIELVTMEESEEVFGYCVSMITEKKIGEIDSIYVDHNLRRSGMGRKLIQRAMDWMNKYGVARKRVYVMVMNEPAKTLYEGFGFVPRQLELVTLPGTDTTSRGRQPD